MSNVVFPSVLEACFTPIPLLDALVVPLVAVAEGPTSTQTIHFVDTQDAVTRLSNNTAAESHFIWKRSWLNTCKT
jgi:hypothetical protein